MFPIQSTFDAEDEAFCRAAVPGFKQFGPVMQVQQCSAARVDVEAPNPAWFYKKSSVAVLQRISPRNSDAKWRVTLNSFANEHEFLHDEPMLQALRALGVGIPQVLALEHGNEKEFTFETVFRTILEYLAPETYREERTYDVSDGKRLLAWLAKFHAYFYGTETSSRFLENGGWWRKALRPTVKFENLGATIAHLCAQFPIELACVAEPDESLIWEELAAIKQRDGFVQKLSSLSNSRKTLLHGDCKSSNFFFHRDAEKSEEGLVMGIDFQWVGSAPSGAADVVYLLFGSVREIWNVELELKDYYFATFTAAAAIKSSGGQDALLSRQEFDLHYDLELLDYFTTIAPYLLSELTPKRMIKNAKKYGYLTYEDDARSLQYLIERVIRAYTNIKPMFMEEEEDQANKRVRSLT